MFQVCCLLQESVKVVYCIPLILETDTFVYETLDTPKKKVQLQIHFN